MTVAKDLIISGGKNIYPYEIETIAKTHKEINDAVCIAKEDATWGQVPALFTFQNVSFLIRN